MTIKCQTCGKSYDYDKDETCPGCGAYNQPLGRAEPAKTAGSGSQGRDYSHLRRRQGFWKSDGGKFLAALLIAFGVIAVASFVMFFSHAVKNEPVPEAPDVQAEVPAVMTEPEEDLASSVVVRPSSPSIYDYATMKYDGMAFDEMDGLVTEVLATGVAAPEGIKEYAGEGGKCIFIAFSVKVTDRSKIEDGVFSLPYVTVAGDTMQMLPFEGSEAVMAEFLPLQWSVLFEEDTVEGQMFYVVPEDCHDFMLRYDSLDGNNTQIKRLSV